MQDILLKATINGIRIYAVNSTNLVEEASFKHGCWALASAALGRTMTGALLLASTFKNNECLTIKIAGNGPLGSILVDSDGTSVRGYVQNSNVELPLKNGKLNVGEGVGKGNIIVTRFSGLKTPVSGSCELVSGEIAEDLTNYLFLSEQTPTCISLGVLVGTDGKVKQAGGFFVQAMPDKDENTLSIINDNINSIPPITVMLEQGLSLEDIIKKICGDSLEPLIHEKIKVGFRCKCSIQTIENMLFALPKEDKDEILKDEITEICCQFCNEKYTFSKEQLKKLFQD